jgi:peptidoglycan/LPS O-acetylase OafA/YrhL
VAFGGDQLITPAWSLSFEFFYYITIPILVGALGLRSWAPKRRIVFFSALAVVYLLFCVLVFPWRDRLAMFISGILLYETMHNTSVPKKLTTPMEWGAIALFLAAFPGIVIIRRHKELLSWLPYFDTASGTYQVALMFVAFGLFALFCYSFDGLIKRAMSWTPLRWYGNMSYSYYLMHGPTILACSWLFHKFLPPRGHQPGMLLLALVVAFVATVVTSTIIFVLVEKPYSLQPKRKQAPAVPAAAASAGAT